MAHQLNASIAGSIAVILGIFFAAALLVGPNGGIIARYKRRKRKYADFVMNLLLVHIWQHEVLGEAEDENLLGTIADHLNWSCDTITGLVAVAGSREYLTTEDGLIKLLPKGIQRARTALER